MKETTLWKMVVGDEHAQAARIEGHPGLERQDDVAEDEKHDVENEQGSRILLPVLRAAVEALFEPAEKAPAAGTSHP